tara:strand:- start:253 stop:942 length:690 start_codon:yes stop_codon:yes gene_type:complete
MYIKATQDIGTLTQSLKIISQILIEKKIEHFIFFGTLLGLIRNERLIKGDDDIDFYVNIKHRDKLINTLNLKKIDVLLNKKPNKTNFFLQINLKYKQNQSKVDFYFYDTNTYNRYILDKWNFDGKPFDNRKFLKIPKVFIFPIKTKKIRNITVQLPNKPELTCEYIYGDKWKQKIKKDIQYEMRIIDGKPVLISYLNSYKKFLAPFRFKNIYISLKKLIFSLINLKNIK